MTLILTLPDNKEAILKARAEARGISAEQYALQIVSRELEEAVAAPTAPEGHISEIVGDIMSDLSPDDFKNLPEDGASEHDHYLYGTPKRNQ
jgi:hypothetical protein